jgi:hypothetical protein
MFLVLPAFFPFQLYWLYIKSVQDPVRDPFEQGRFIGSDVRHDQCRVRNAIFGLDTDGTRLA